GSTSGAELLRDPLWYAAKWGGFNDANGNGIPDPREWDSREPGTPNNYFLVTNALTLSDQLRQAFKEITELNATAAAATFNSGFIGVDTRVYQGSFDAGTWTGQLLARRLGADGKILQGPDDVVWSAS